MSEEQVVQLIEDLVETMGEPSAADWTGALATAATAVVAAIALIYAWMQVREAKAARKLTADLDIERSQPYVVAFMEPSEVSNLAIDFVVKNFGATAARDVKVSMDPRPRRSAEGGKTEELLYPRVIPILAPGQEWRTSWDITARRSKTGLPSLHEGRVTFRGLGGGTRESPVTMDWSVYSTRRWNVVYGMHTAASSLKKVAKTLSQWTEGASGPLGVMVRDGDKADREWENRIAEGDRIPHDALLEQPADEKGRG